MVSIFPLHQLIGEDLLVHSQFSNNLLDVSKSFLQLLNKLTASFVQLFLLGSMRCPVNACGMAFLHAHRSASACRSNLSSHSQKSKGLLLSHHDHAMTKDLPVKSCKHLPRG